MAVLSDGNRAGVGDLLRARLNVDIDAGGQRLTNRDMLKVTSICGPEVTVRRQRQDATWTAPFKVPRSYLESSAELAYAGNVHVAQGRTVDTAHLLVTDTLTRRSFYVGMTRGRQSNTAHVVTGSTAPEGKQPYEQARPESVIKSIMLREPDDLSAIEQIRQSQEWVGGTGHLLNLWSAAVRSRLIPEMDERIKARLSESEASRYQRERARRVLRHKLRQYQLAGHDLNQLIDRIAAGYREAAGITDPQQAISPEPHSASPELDAMREATIGALEIAEDPYRAMTCGQLEAKVAQGDWAQTLAPPDVSGQLRLTAQAEADAWQQSADAEVRHDQAEAASAKALAGQLGAEKARLEGIHADYESWSGKTSEAREVAGKAQAELQRRGAQPREPEQSLVEWNRQFEHDLAAVDRAIAREQQAALDAGKPWPPERKTPEPSPDPDARRVIEEPAADVGQPGNRAARLNELQARADEAALRIATEETEQQASAEYIARIERQAQAELQPDWSAERHDAEMEL